MSTRSFVPVRRGSPMGKCSRYGRVVGNTFRDQRLSQSGGNNVNQWNIFAACTTMRCVLRTSANTYVPYSGNVRYFIFSVTAME